MKTKNKVNIENCPYKQLVQLVASLVILLGR